MDDASEKERTLVALGAKPCDWDDPQNNNDPCDSLATKQVGNPSISRTFYLCSRHAKPFARWLRMLRHESVRVENL